MSLDYLLKQFDAIGPTGPRAQITIDQKFTGSAELATMWSSVLDTNSVTINAVTDMTSRADDHLTLIGTASILGMTDTQVTFYAKEVDGELDVSLEITVAPG